MLTNMCGFPLSESEVRDVAWSGDAGWRGVCVGDLVAVRRRNGHVVYGLGTFTKRACAREREIESGFAGFER